MTATEKVERVQGAWATPERKFAVRDVLRLWRERWPLHGDRLMAPAQARRYLYAVAHVTPAAIRAAGAACCDSLRSTPPTCSEWERAFPREARAAASVWVAVSVLAMRWGGPTLVLADRDDPSGAAAWSWLASAMSGAATGMGRDACLQSCEQVRRNLAVLGADVTWWDAACDPARRSRLVG
jgi:hypothetical protein